MSFAASPVSLPLSPIPFAAPAARCDALAPHLSRAQAVARRLLGCDHLAADVLQDAHLSFSGLTTAPPNPRGWLVRAVVLRSRQLRRTLNRRRHHEHVASQHCRLHAGCDNPLHVAVAHELGAKLRRALDTLPSEQRLTLELYSEHALDYRGLAQRLELPVGTVRSRLHRAREALRLALAPHLRD